MRMPGKRVTDEGKRVVAIGKAVTFRADGGRHRRLDHIGLWLPAGSANVQRERAVNQTMAANRYPLLGLESEVVPRRRV